MSDDTFNWQNTKQLSILQIILAFLIPSAIAFTGFRFVLPILVEGGTPAIIAWPAVASIMLFVFVLVAIVFLNKEAKELNISFKERACLQSLSSQSRLGRHPPRVSRGLRRGGALSRNGLEPFGEEILGGGQSEPATHQLGKDLPVGGRHRHQVLQLGQRDSERSPGSSRFSPSNTSSTGTSARASAQSIRASPAPRSRAADSAPCVPSEPGSGCSLPQCAASAFDVVGSRGSLSRCCRQ